MKKKYYYVTLHSNLNWNKFCNSFTAEKSTLIVKIFNIYSMYETGCFRQLNASLAIKDVVYVVLNATNKFVTKTLFCNILLFFLIFVMIFLLSASVYPISDKI